MGAAIELHHGDRRLAGAVGPLLREQEPTAVGRPVGLGLVDLRRRAQSPLPRAVGVHDGEVGTEWIDGPREDETPAVRRPGRVGGELSEGLLASRGG